MKLAPDGLPYDEDYLGRGPYANEVEVIQFLRPNSRRRKLFAPVEREVKTLAETFNLIISAEVLPTNDIAIWVRGKGEDEDEEIMELAKNTEGENDPSYVLSRLVERKVQQLLGKESKNV